MTGTEEQKVGRFSIEVELASFEDLVREKDGAISAADVRRVRVRGVVDSGATRLVIPEKVALQLGLAMSGSAKVRYADGRTAERSIAQGIYLSYGGRESIFNTVVEPARGSALIGAIVMEDLDFLIDCIHQRLVPRDPNQIVSEAE